MTKDIAIAGAGFAGAVLARQLAETGRFHVDVLDRRPHVAGNCHTARDAASGIMLHNYGPHIFHTDREDVWNYVRRFARFEPFVNRVKAITNRGVFGLPINLMTINQFFHKTLDPREAAAFVAALGSHEGGEPQSFEEQALRFIGRDLYEAFFYGYTKKQWGVEPRYLPASILKRLPVRYSYDDNYYASKYQGMPVSGYTALITNILDHPGISVHLGEGFVPAYRKQYHHVFYSGPIDEFYGFTEGRLGYRSLTFERFDHAGPDYQGNAVLNYCEEKVPWTRISEHKHFASWEQHTTSVCFREFSHQTEAGETPYYPLNLAADRVVMQRYRQRAALEQGLTFIGRLGTYRYLDMHMVIGESLDLGARCSVLEHDLWPVFGGAAT